MNPHVKALQQRLKNLNLYQDEIDGDFGPQTLAAALKGLSSEPKMIALPIWMDDLLVILEEFEAFKSRAYYDATGKVWTIGIGTTIYPNGSKVKMGDVCTKAQAVGYVQHDIMTIRLPALNTMILKPLNDNQKAALISFIYNVGVGGFKNSGLRKSINSGVTDKAKITTNFMAFSQSGGVTLQGLKKRRLAEAKLYFTPVVEGPTLAAIDEDKDAKNGKVDLPWGS